MNRALLVLALFLVAGLPACESGAYSSRTGPSTPSPTDGPSSDGFFLGRARAAPLQEWRGGGAMNTEGYDHVPENRRQHRL